MFKRASLKASFILCWSSWRPTDSIIDDGDREKPWLWVLPKGKTLHTKRGRLAFIRG